MANKKAVLDIEKYQPSKEVTELSDQLQAVIGYNPITHAFKLANAIGAVQQWMEHPEIGRLLQLLENTQGGFVTDKDPGVFYPPKTRTQCVMDALTNGVRINGNEFNIISGKMMIVQAGWKRLCDEMGHDVPGGFSPEANYKTINLYIHDEGKPVINGNIATITMVIDFELLNKSTEKIEAGQHKRDISITIKSRDTVDAWIGKAERRIYRDFFRKYSGKTIADVDTGEFDGAPLTSAAPPLGDQQGKKDPVAVKTKVVVQKPNKDPNERPTTTEVPVEDGEYSETTPEMNNALDSLPGNPEPEAPPTPPEGVQTSMIPNESPQPAAPAAQATNRPKTNF